MRHSILALAIAATACGGGGPAAPQAPPPSASALDFTLIPQHNGASEVQFRWSGANATSYRIEIGTTSGGSEAASLDVGGATSFTWTRVPIGTFYARVRGAAGATLGASSNEVVVGSIDARRMVDALLFGFGPLAVAGNVGRSLNTGIWQDRTLGWQPGSGFGVVLGESVPAAYFASAEKTVQQIGPATRGAITAGIVGRRADPLPSPAPGEVSVRYFADAAALHSERSCDDCVGCARTFYSGAFAQRAQIYLGPESGAATIAHELGHVIGLAHVINAAGVRPPFTMGVTTDGRFSPNGRLDMLEPASIRMLETVYAAGFSAGTHRRTLEAAGFVLPEAAGVRQPEARSDPGVVRQDGFETVVLKRICR